ncbi:hypothetical protein FRC12_004891 [Ceratobasidium sp. 428]|nr:hypothetical protein FRC12_004891 [Ceratobasidium sp. 428]
MTKNVPHPEKSELAIINAVLIRKAIPNRPLGDIPVGCMRGDMLWEILKLCWAYEPQDRPNAEEVKNAIIDITNAEHMLKNSEVVESVITSNSSSINTPVEQASGLNHVMDLCPSLESVTSVRRATRRRALIIAFDYKHTDNLGDSQSDIKSLNSASNDARDLAATFVDRGYSVETIIEEAYNREDVLDTIAGFLGSAVAGDVHVIIFSGHAARTDGTSSSPAMVLPVTSANKLHADDWNRNIRAHAKPGVIVLSVIATCYSGGFVERGTRIIDIERIPKAEGVVNEPIYITFSASGPFEVAYESPIDSDDPEYHCHLLWAVAGTVRDQEIKSWDEFIMGLRERFSYARVKGLAARGGEGQNGVKWLCDHPQHPEFTTTAPGYLPAWDVIFPANAE